MIKERFDAIINNIEYVIKEVNNNDTYKGMPITLRLYQIKKYLQNNQSLLTKNNLTNNNYSVKDSKLYKGGYI